MTPTEVLLTVRGPLSCKPDCLNYMYKDAFGHSRYSIRWW